MYMDELCKYFHECSEIVKLDVNFIVATLTFSQECIESQANVNKSSKYTHVKLKEYLIFQIYENIQTWVQCQIPQKVTILVMTWLYEARGKL